MSDFYDHFYGRADAAEDQDVRERRRRDIPLKKDERQELVFRLMMRGLSTRLLAKVLNVSRKQIRLDIIATQNLNYQVGNISMVTRKAWLGETLRRLRLMQQEAFIEYQRAEDGTSTKAGGRRAFCEILQTEIELMTRIGVVNRDLGLSASEFETDDDLMGVSEEELRRELMQYYKREFETGKEKVLDLKALPVTPPKQHDIIARRDPPRMEEEKDFNVPSYPQGSTYGISVEDE